MKAFKISRVLAKLMRLYGGHKVIATRGAYSLQDGDQPQPADGTEGNFQLDLFSEKKCHKKSMKLPVR